MLHLKKSYGVLVVLAGCFVTRAAASPQASKLLPLVPADAQIVAGIEDPHNPESHGRLLLVTHNDNLDFEDFVAITGVDSDRHVDEVIEAAASSERGELAEHLLLVAGRFDGEHIFEAARRNGAHAEKYRGAEVLAVDPLAREQAALRSERWMAILDDRVAIFGTPSMVKEAIDRAVAHEAVDAALAARISKLRPDVNSWDVLAMPKEMLTRHLAPGLLNVSWAGALNDTDELVLGIHYGTTARVDFAVHSADGQTPALAALLEKPRVLKVSGLVSANAKSQTRVERLSVDGSSIQGSIALPGKEFDAFLEAMYQSRVAGARR